MKITYLLPIFLTILMLISACKKDNVNDNPEEKEFAKPVWSWQSNQSIQFSAASVPAIDNQNNSYYIIKQDTALSLLSLDNTGSERWLVDVPFPDFYNSSGSVVLSGNNFYFHNGRYIYCYSKDNGDELWHYKIDFPASSIHNLLIKDSEVWFTYGEGGDIILEKLNENGVKLWSNNYSGYSTNLGMSSFNEKLIMLNKDHYGYHVDVLSVSLDDGSIYWTSDPDIESAGEDPVIDSDGNVYFSTYEGEIVAINAVDGSVRWTFKDQSYSKMPRFVNGVSITILPNNDIVFPLNYLYCFDVNGNEKWKFAMDSYMTTTLGNNGILYGWGGYNEYYEEISLFAIGASTGEIISEELASLDADLTNMAPPLSIDRSGNLIGVGLNKIHCISSLSDALEPDGWSKIGKGYENNCVR